MAKNQTFIILICKIMALINNETCFCSQVQQSLNLIAGINAPSLIRDATGTINFLKSSENTTGFEAIKIDNKQGDYRQVRVNWITRKGSSWVRSCTTDCTSNRKPVPDCATVSVSECLETEPMLIPESDLRLYCEPLNPTNAAYIASNVNSLMNAFAVAINKRVIQLLKAQIGQFLDGDLMKEVQLFNSFKHSVANYDGPRAFAISRIVDEYQREGYSGKPAVIGGFSNLNLFFMAMKMSAVNSLGVDSSQANNLVNYYFDKYVDGIIGDKEFLTLVPGVAQLLEWDQYVGEFARSVPNLYEHGGIVDPFTNMRYDMEFYYEPCAKKHYIKLLKYFDIFTLPTDSYEDSDELFGVNGILNWKECDDLSECSDVPLPGSESRILSLR